MSKDIQKQKAKLNQLNNLIGKYTQSRTLGLWAGAVVVLINTIVLLGSIELAKFLILADKSWWLVPIVFAFLWVLISTVWLIWFETEHGYSFYDKKEGTIKVKKEKVSMLACAAFVITFLGPTFLSEFNIMTIRSALIISLMSFGIFLFYLSKKHKEKTVGIVFGGLCLITAAATAVGIPTILAGKNWVYSYFLTLNIYVVGAGLVTMVVVHMYNRRVLRKIKELRPLDECKADKSNT